MKGNTDFKGRVIPLSNGAWRILEKRLSNTRKPTEWPGIDVRIGAVSQYSRRPDIASMVIATCAFWPILTCYS